ncbi:dTDP-glucose 4,6-dehydratase [Desulfofustis limnaeus]|jgi:dTDP-glucose 4,6-dehydratase|uniref:dTDP-glucose 4,6-dehydratase n=1 Tax=Desulfofustis limnaeus TaxID=2740163 RepID=A0ABM7W6U7_9BACT|nr:dTDP-glucose 4,6-dehydratase [Desulfofustis limnaeus]MDX9896784.1 dTDP-glucose 4,6-dehydratase [Desulfofustis sp.]BDD86679.1 dTDP-glucose 4,6-dehydratase [Desulfofustis limnaeus]
MNDEKRTLLVTGGCGFIGCNFVRLVNRELPHWRLINLDKLTYAGNLQSLAGVEENERYRFVCGDIGDAELVERLFGEEQIDTVVHFAAESHVDRSIVGPGEFIRTNIVGTFTLLEAARRHWPGQNGGEARRFLHISTDEVYGSLGATGLFSETTPYDPRSPYSASKASSDHLVSAYFHTYGLPAVITNCSNNYGPYQFPEKLIPLVCNNALQGLTLPVYGDGKNIRDWLHVEDHCRALVAVLQRGRPGHHYNVGGNSEMANIDVVRMICDLLDQRVGLLPDGRQHRELITFVRDRLGHDRRYAIDASKIKAEIGWQPAIRFADGLAATIDWYLEHRAWLEAVLDGSYQDYYRTMYGHAEGAADLG